MTLPAAELSIQMPEVSNSNAEQNSTLWNVRRNICLLFWCKFFLNPQKYLSISVKQWKSFSVTAEVFCFLRGPVITIDKLDVWYATGSETYWSICVAVILPIHDSLSICALLPDDMHVNKNQKAHHLSCYGVYDVLSMYYDQNFHFFSVSDHWNNHFHLLIFYDNLFFSYLRSIRK